MNSWKGPDPPVRRKFLRQEAHSWGLVNELTSSRDNAVARWLDQPSFMFAWCCSPVKAIDPFAGGHAAAPSNRTRHRTLRGSCSKRRVFRRDARFSRASESAENGDLSDQSEACPMTHVPATLDHAPIFRRWLHKPAGERAVQPCYSRAGRRAVPRYGPQRPASRLINYAKKLSQRIDLA
jgi:hypothetical protein